jgi:hypothetical protein
LIGKLPQITSALWATFALCLPAFTLALAAERKGKVEHARACRRAFFIAPILWLLVAAITPPTSPSFGLISELVSGLSIVTVLKTPLYWLVCLLTFIGGVSYKMAFHHNTPLPTAPIDGEPEADNKPAPLKLPPAKASTPLQIAAQHRGELLLVTLENSRVWMGYLDSVAVDKLDRFIVLNQACLLGDEEWAESEDDKAVKVPVIMLRWETIIEIVCRTHEPPRKSTKLNVVDISRKN